MNHLINELTDELKSNPNIKDSIAVRVTLEAINNSSTLGLPNDQILEMALSNLSELASATMNESLKEVVAKFKSMAQKPTASLQNMAKEAGLTLKLKALKESAIYKDPIFAQTVLEIEKQLAVLPEFRTIGVFMEAFGKFAYEPEVSEVLNEVSSYVNGNRSKLEIINAVYEMRKTSSVLYSGIVSELENCLLEGILTADSIKMKLRGKPQMPIITRLINTLSLVESRQDGTFNIGIGDGSVKVKPVVAPFCKISESEAIVFVDNNFIKLTDGGDPTQVEVDEISDHIEFRSVCEAFSALNFRETESGLVAKGRSLEIGFVINENGTLGLTINGEKVEDLTKIKYAEIFLMEKIETRNNLSNLFNGLDMIVNIEFAKKIVNERLHADSIVLNMNESIFVFEKYGNGRLVKKMEGLEFHNYVLENFNYDISEMYAIELEEQEVFGRGIESEKKLAETDMVKLEAAMLKIEEALSGSEVSDEYRTQLEDLKISLEQNVNSIRNHYIELDQYKKKL